MDFLKRAPGRPGTLAIFPGSFHPITRAHLALAGSALTVAGEVLLTMPRRFPHKDYDDVPLETRIAAVAQAAATDSRLSVAITERGLFLDIAREVAPHYPGAELWFLCGRDAAERIATWDYAEPFESQLREYGLLVADRLGKYEPPPHWSERVRHLDFPGEWDAVSASEVRRRIASGEPWRDLVPESAAELIERAYRRGG